MKLGADTLIYRVVEVDSFISVTHTLKDQSGRRISDITSVDDLLESLPSLNEPVIEAVPYDTDYYNKWARVSRNDETRRASLRPVTVTVKSWTLLNAIPTISQPCTEIPASPRRHSTNTSLPKSSISSCKSLDSIIEHYNKLFPLESGNGAKPNLTITKHKETPIKSDNQFKTTHPNLTGDNTLTRENSMTSSSRTFYQGGKAIPIPVSPKRKLSVLLNPERSISPEQNFKLDKSPRKNTLQVPLPTSFVSLEWPSTLPPSESYHKSSQFLACAPKKAGGHSTPRTRSPDPLFNDQQSQRKDTVVQLGELKMIQLSASSLSSPKINIKRNVDRRQDRSSYDSDNIIRFGSVRPLLSSSYKNISESSDETLDCRSTLDDKEYNTMPQIKSNYSPLMCRSNSNEVTLDSNQRQNHMGKGVIHHRVKGLHKQIQDNSILFGQPDSYINKNHDDDMSYPVEGTRHHSRRRSKSGKSLQENTKIVSEERQRSSRSRTLKHRRSGPPVVQFLDLRDLKVIFDKAANVQRQ